MNIGGHYLILVNVALLNRDVDFYENRNSVYCMKIALIFMCFTGYSGLTFLPKELWCRIY